MTSIQPKKKLTVLWYKSSNDDVPNKYLENLHNNNTDIFKSIISAIEAIRGKIKRPDIDAIYHHLSKSEATNVDSDFLV